MGVTVVTMFRNQYTTEQEVELQREAEAEERQMIDTLFQLLHEVGAVILLEDIRRLQTG